MIAAVPADAGVAVRVDDSVHSIFDADAEAGMLHAEGTAREADMARLIDACLAQQAKLILKGPSIAPAAQVLTALLANLIEKGSSAKVEVAQQVSGGTLTIAVRSEALAFSHRVGTWTEADQGVRLLAGECAGLLNLGWVKRVTTSPDGSTLSLSV